MTRLLRKERNKGKEKGQNAHDGERAIKTEMKIAARGRTKKLKWKQDD